MIALMASGRSKCTTECCMSYHCEIKTNQETLYNFQNHIRGKYAWLGRTDVEREGVYKNLDGTKTDFKSYAKVCIKNSI